MIGNWLEKGPWSSFFWYPYYQLSFDIIQELHFEKKAWSFKFKSKKVSRERIGKLLKLSTHMKTFFYCKDFQFMTTFDPCLLHWEGVLFEKGYTCINQNILSFTQQKAWMREIPLYDETLLKHRDWP